MKATIFVLYSLLCISGYKGLITRRPVRVFHGLGRSCEDEKILSHNYKCVETGSGTSSFVKSIEDQAMKGCRYLQKEIDTLMPSFYIMAYSQGGLIARWIQLNCKYVAPLIKRIVLIGTPNLGIDKFPKSDAYSEKVYSKAEIKHLIETNQPWLEEQKDFYRISVIEQLHDKTKSDEKVKLGSVYNAGIKLSEPMKSFCKFFELGPFNYLNKKPRYSTFIEEISKENEIGNLNTLDLFVIIANRDERIVIPPESVTFGINILDEEGNTIPNPQTSNFIKEHPMIQDLWKDKRMITCLSDTSHSDIDKNELFLLDSTIFSEVKEAEDYQHSSLLMLKKFLNENSNYCAYNDQELNLSKKPFNEVNNGKPGVLNIEFIVNKILI